MYEIMVEDTFASAHQLIGYEGACENLHGHTWKVQVFIKGSQLDKLGMLFDFKIAKNILKDILNIFDHKNINTLPEFTQKNPTAENLAKTIFKMFIKMAEGRAEVSKIIVWEYEKTCATYTL